MAFRRKWLQFGLKSLLLLTVMCALTITWWRQWKQSEELTTMHCKLQYFEAESEYQRNLNLVLRSLDLENPQHRHAFNAFQDFIDNQPYHSSQNKRIGDFEVSLIHFDDSSMPGSIVSVAAALRDCELIDVVVRESATRQEWHDIKFVDTDNDGRVELVFECRPSGFGNSKPFTVVYKISNTGFAKIE